MTPFNNELQVGQPAMIINVQRYENIGSIGKTVKVLTLLDIEQSRVYFHNYPSSEINEPYAVIDDDSVEGGCGMKAIIQRFLMPLPPLGDVYDSEMMDEMENLKVHN